MALSKDDRFQRGLNFAIIDEVDSILIDEARTPLIISGPADETPDLYIKVNRVVPRLVRQTEEEGEGDYWSTRRPSRYTCPRTARSTPSSCCAKPASSKAKTTTSTPRTTSTSSTTSTPACARTASTSATWTTSSATAR